MSAAPSTSLSFEFFPPRDLALENRFWDTVQHLAGFKPHAVSITYGAGGSQRDFSVDLVLKAQQEHHLPVIPHLTSVGDREEHLRHILSRLQKHGIERILALRGDRPTWMSDEQFKQSAFPYTHLFVAYIRQYFPQLQIGIAAYPEGHPQSPDKASDLAYFKQKVDAGASFAMTQFFFDNDVYFKYLDDCQKLNIHIPIHPGIIPITDFAQIQRFSALCGSDLPAWLCQKMEHIKHDPQAMTQAGIDIAVNQCQQLMQQGVTTLHFFTLNRKQIVHDILTQLGFTHHPRTQ